MKNNKISNLLLSLLMTFVILVAFYICYERYRVTFSFSLVWLVSSSVVLFYFYSYTFRWLPKKIKLDKLKNARIIAIVPTFNEDPKLLKQTVDSILAQSFQVQAIHVVDDGSKTSVEAFADERVFLHRQANQGKRHAQVTALSHMNEADVDFILTVDSDSVLAVTAVEKLLLAFEKDDLVQCCTGFVVTRNYKKNLMTRISDLNIGISCIVTRPSRSVTGSLETTSGALSMYKKNILFDNIQHYLTSGTYSDDRQLCLYSAIKGKAIGIQEALVYSDMPTTFSGFCKQRARWGKGGWKYFPFQVTNLSIIDLFFPFIGMVQWLATPFFWVALAYSIFTKRYHFFITYVILRLIIRYLEAALYLLGVPNRSRIERFLTWLFLTPVEVFFSSFILVFVKYYSLFTIGKESWGTRK